MQHVYGDKPETILYKVPNGRKVSNHVLLGTWLELSMPRFDGQRDKR